MDVNHAPRLFVAAPLFAGARVPATAAQAHHLGTVLRRSPGDPVRLFNGAEGEWAGRIAALRRGACEVEVERALRPQSPEPDLWLAFALLKRDATDLVARQATELGAARLLPVLSERTQASRANLDRLAAIATEAAEQCERLTVPVLAPPATLAVLLAGWPAGRPLAAAVERADLAPLSAPMGGLLVGPEGGWAPGELDLLRRHPFVTAVSLGPRILRAETAAIAGLALLQARLAQS